MIAAADEVAVASDTERQPLVVLEAVDIDRAVVATFAGRVPEMVLASATLRNLFLPTSGFDR